MGSGRSCTTERSSPIRRLNNVDLPTLGCPTIATDAEASESLPKVMWLSAAEVARQAVAGMDANKSVVIPGLPNRMASAFGWLSPRGILVPMLVKRHPALRP